MKDEGQTEKQLIQELEDLHRGRAELEKSETERKRAEEAQRENEERYRSLSSTEDSMYFIDRECRYRFMNKAHLLRLGLSLDKVIGRSYGEFHSEEDTKQFADKVESVIATGHSFQTEHRSERDNGYFLRTFSPVKDLQGSITDVTVISKDITERKRVEELLFASEGRLKAQYQGSPIPTFTWQKKGEDFELVDYNNAAKVVTKGEVIKFFGKTANEMYQDSPEILQDIHRCFTKKETIKKELRSQHFMPGRTMVVTFAFVPPDLITVYTDDITERKRVEEALRESEERYRTILENIEEGYYEADLAGNLTFFNDPLMRIHAYPREELLGMHSRDYTDAENGRILTREFTQAYLSQKSSKGIQYEIITKNGDRRNLETSISLMRDPSGNPIGFRGIARDITELRRAQEALQKSEERFRVAAESANDFIFEWDFKSGQVDWFGNAVERFGHLLGELPVTAASFEKIIHPEDINRFSAIKRQLENGDPYREEYRVIGKNGNMVYLKSVGACLRKETGEPYKWIGAISDITDRKKAEEALKTLSVKDDLTGLYNRRGFFTLAEQWLKTAQRMGTEMLLIFGDLDGMKQINDSFGHNEGDQALMDISQILKETFRESDTVARIGGDEFVILAMNSLETPAEKLIDRFEKVLNDRSLQTGRAYKLSMSFGMACFDPKNPSSIDVLMAQADKLMYENKQKGVKSKIKSDDSL